MKKKELLHRVLLDSGRAVHDEVARLYDEIEQAEYEKCILSDKVDFMNGQLRDVFSVLNKKCPEPKYKTAKEAVEAEQREYEEWLNKEPSKMDERFDKREEILTNSHTYTWERQ